MLDKAPNQKISGLLRSLDQALVSDDVECAINLFQADCYWRDLVAFTWNIKTMEGRDQVPDMLKPFLPYESLRAGRLRTAKTQRRQTASSKAGSNSKLTWRAATATYV